jgi:hypothetical protein
LLIVAGGIGVHGSDKVNVHCLLGATYGTGCALVTDELPLLLDLRDVYWAPEGRWALEVALGIIASAGAYFSGSRSGTACAKRSPESRRRIVLP